MKEFLLLIRTEGDCAERMSPELHKIHFQKVVNYIDNLRTSGNLISAQPLTMCGSIIQGKANTFKDGPFIESKEVIAGYFLFRASDFEEALEISLPTFSWLTAVQMDLRTGMTRSRTS